MQPQTSIRSRTNETETETGICASEIRIYFNAAGNKFEL